MGVDELERYRNITHTHLLLVEDDDDVGFFKELLTHWGLNNTDIWAIGREERFERNLGVLKTDFGNLKSLGIIQDAKDDPTATFDAIKLSLERNGLSAPEMYGQRSEGSPVISIFILPDGMNQKGVLESLCIRALEGDQILSCANSYIKCLTENGVSFDELEADKARVLAYSLASSHSIKSLGGLALSGVLQLDGDAFEGMRIFLIGICNI